MNQLLGRNFDSTAMRKLNKLDKTDRKCLTWDLKPLILLYQKISGIANNEDIRTKFFLMVLEVTISILLMILCVGRLIYHALIVLTC